LFLGGGFGWFHLLQRLLYRDPSDPVMAGLVYVIGRNPHHLLPGAWPPSFWAMNLLLALLLFLVLIRRGSGRPTGFLSAYATGSILLFGYGLLLYTIRLIPLLKYYWFRLADVMVPLLCLMFLGLGIQYTMRWVQQRISVHQTHLRFEPVLCGLGWSVLTILLAFSAWQIKVPPLRPDGPPLALLNARVDPMLKWISCHTPPQAVFLVDPLMWDFYVKARRAMFVSAKHMPCLNQDILEWFERMKLCNGGKQPEHRDFRALLQLHRNFYQLDPSALMDMAKRYGIDYYLGKTEHVLPFESVHSTEDYTLYRISLKTDSPLIALDY
jgi:hypothetical protein